MMMKMSRIKRMRLMYIQVEVPSSETGEEGTERRDERPTAEQLDAAATRSAATVTEPLDARDTSNSAPLSPHRAAALDRSPSFPFCFLLSASCQSVYSTLILPVHSLYINESSKQNPRTQKVPCVFVFV